MLLIIHNDKRKSRALSDIFYHMGVVSRAISTDEIRDELSEIYRAVVVLDPENITVLSDIKDLASAYNVYIPLFAVSSRVNDRFCDIFDEVIKNDLSPSSMLDIIVSYQTEHDLRISAQYKIAGIEASLDVEGINVFESNVIFTKTETMILRYLIGSYPAPQDAESIVKYAFKQLRAPDPSSIRTHVSVMNRKCRDVQAKKLFLSIPGKGYVIATPETVPWEAEAAVH